MDMPSMDVQKPNTERVAQKPISAKNASDRKVQMRRLNLFVLDAGPSIKVRPNASRMLRFAKWFGWLQSKFNYMSKHFLKNVFSFS